MRFRYAFQKIVDLKTNEKTQAEWMLSDAIGKLKEEEHSLNELVLAKQEQQRQLSDASANKMTISELMVMQHYIDHFDQRILDKSRDLEQAKTVVSIKQEDLNGKMLQEKVWSKAKERAYQQFSAKMLKQEQGQLDEMATNRFQRLS